MRTMTTQEEEEEEEQDEEDADEESDGGGGEAAGGSGAGTSGLGGDPTDSACADTEEEEDEPPVADGPIGGGKAPQLAASYKLSEIPAELEAELAALERWRLSPINMSRKGVAVTAVTSQKQRENVVRLLGWLVHKKKLARPTLNAFGSVQIGAAVQLYINFLVDEKQRKYSSIAV